MKIKTIITNNGGRGKKTKRREVRGKGVGRLPILTDV